MRRAHGFPLPRSGIEGILAPAELSPAACAAEPGDGIVPLAELAGAVGLIMGGFLPRWGRRRRAAAVSQLATVPRT
jgi:hypothetical protein